MEQVANQIANLRANVATYESSKANLELARANLKRGEQLAPSGGISKEELDVRRQTVKVDEAAVKQALQEVYATRAGLGLPAQPANGHDLTEVPPDLEQTFSGCPDGAVQPGPDHGPARPAHGPRERHPQAVPGRVSASGTPSGDVDRILEALVPNAPAVKQAEAKLLEAPPRPGPGRAEPPLLRRRQRDRRRGDPPQRQPRQQRPGGAEPDGRPLAHGDLDRRQLQGDATGGPAHRPARALRGRHVRPPARVRGPHHRLHHGDRLRRWPCCRRRTPPATS